MHTLSRRLPPTDMSCTTNGASVPRVHSKSDSTVRTLTLAAKPFHGTFYCRPHENENG
jgi:hypothetical protein